MRKKNRIWRILKEYKIDQRVCLYQTWKVTVNLNSGVYEDLKHTNI